MKKPVVGQEAVCPDGLGRIRSYDEDWVCIDTYINNRSCKWAWSSVRLVHLDFGSEYVRFCSLVTEYLESTDYLELTDPDAATEGFVAFQEWLKTRF